MSFTINSKQNKGCNLDVFYRKFGKEKTMVVTLLPLHLIVSSKKEEAAFMQFLTNWKRIKSDDPYAIYCKFETNLML